MKKYYLFLAVLGLILFGYRYSYAWGSYAAIYNSYINFYNSSLRNDGWSSSLYFNIGDYRNNSFELGLGETFIDYFSNDDLWQTDFTLIYNNINQLLSNHVFSFGLHYIVSDDYLTDKGIIYYFKSLYYQYQKWNAGIEMSFSAYTSSPDDVLVFQFSPFIGVYFKLFGKELYSESKFIYIKKTSDISLASSVPNQGKNNYVDLSDTNDNYYSFEQLFSYNYKNFKFFISFWLGKQIFAVKNECFVVYNLPDEYLGGFKTGAVYNLKKRLYFSIFLSFDKLKHVDISDKTLQSVITFSLGKNF